MAALRAPASYTISGDTTEAKVLLMQLSERTSAKGLRYLSGFLGKAKLVAFLDQEPDKFGNPQWSVYASEPPPRGDGTAAGDRVAGAGPGFIGGNSAPARAHARGDSRG